MHISILYTTATSQYSKTKFFAADEDTKLSAIEIADALKKKHIRVSLVPLRRTNIEKTIRSIHADCIFNLIEWGGADLPYALYAFGFLEQTGIPFTGATTENYLLVSNKIYMKQVFDDYDIPTAKWQAFINGHERIRSDFHYPLIVKPALEHCSIGLTYDMIVSNKKALRGVIQTQLKRFKNPVFAEEFIDGREFHVSVLEQHGKPVVHPIVEITYHVKGTRAFLTYESRWDVDHPDYQNSDIGVAKLSPALRKKIEKVCRDIFTKLRYRDYIRVDIRVRRGKIFVLEANCNPGLGDDEDSATPIAHKAAGMEFSEFVWEIVQSCMRRFGASLS